MGLESGEVEPAEIGILEVAVDDAVASTEHHLIVEHGRRPGEPNARTKVLLPNIGPAFVHISVPTGSNAREHQHPRQIAGSRVGLGHADIRSVAVRFSFGFVNVITKTKVQSKSWGDFDGVLHETGKIAA